MNRAKQFEGKFKSDWQQNFPQSFILRLHDQMSGYKVQSRNICDYICFENRTLFLIECKTHSGASIPFDDIPQYDLMKDYVGLPNVRTGIVLWLYEKDIGILYIPISTITKLKEKGEKSIGIRHLKQDYKIISLPSEKRRVYYDCDYSPLLNLNEGE